MEFRITSAQQNFCAKKFLLEYPIWNQVGFVVFKKKYNYQQLNDAFNEAIRINDSLRLRITQTSEGYVANVFDFNYTVFPFLSFDSELQILEQAKIFANQPIDLNGPLIKCIVFHTPDGSGFLLCAHHIIVDGFSTQVLASHLYKFLQDNTKALESFDSYEDYVKKEELYKSSTRYNRDKKFWGDQFFAKLVCNVFEEKKTALDYSSHEVNYSISTNLFNKIKKLCVSNDISVQTYFNTVYATYIYRTLGYDKFTIGVPVLNRTTEAELNTVGLYMHIVPLLVNISNGTFLENAFNIEDSQMNLFRHQKFTQHDIKELLKEQDIPVNSLFDIVSDYQAFEENNDYEFKLIYSNSLSVPIEIHLQSFGKEKHNLKIRYRTSMFSQAEMKTMLNSIIAIAEDAIKNPNKKISELEMISSAEKQKLLFEFNNTAHAYPVPEGSTIYSLFEKTANEKKHKTCITISEKAVTFGELLRLSEILDAEIRNITGDKKSVIAVIAERSVEMYAAIYGIIRGGNAYLPISPDYPNERIEYILKNSSAALVIAQDKFADFAGDVPCIDMTDFIENPPAINELMPCIADADDAAYVIYTSGSTGNPKGAKISHRSAVNRILWMQDSYPLENDSVILQKTPYTFDVSVWEIFWWGMCGGSLTISKPGEHFLPAKILDEVHNHKVTHLHFVPSVFDLFLTYLEMHKDECFKFRYVKHVFLSGEALSAAMIQRFYALYDYGSVKLHNLYGPTECAVDVTYYDCTPDDADPVPIGRPIYNTSIYVVDKYMNILPQGVKGELCIGGVNVGQGYLNNKELTAEKFINNPYGVGKLYKTGDLAYWREDGQIIFCGRMDGQIKLGGQRIEIGEIESVIESIPEVESAAVIMRKVGEQDTLVAFYCGEKNSEEAVRSVCETKLPKYMVPGAVCHIDKMPLNQSGKLDRKALSGFTVDTIETTFIESPVNETERLICEAFSKILKSENIGRNSDFFVCGGSSLSMISLLSDDEFKDITAAEFMANPTPAKLAELMKNKRKTELKYLEILWEADKEERAMVLFPFAGGGAEAYVNFVNSVKAQSNNTSLYFVRYLHKEEKCEEAAKEISKLLRDTDVYFYSHCVGSAIAMQILGYLEKDKTCNIKHFIAGASIPPAKSTKRNIWNIVPDRVLKAILVSAGAPLKDISKEKVAVMLKKFRTDTDFAVQHFAVNNRKIKVPTSVVISKNDMFTSNYNQAEKIWKKYAENVKGIYFIDSSNHYFQSESSDDLVKKVLSIIT